ncbi:NrsF family protein [Haliangium ochraceum]|uniref:DUF1109 domain-containing protein n=1 Tax=Haliangium ochraceum (strain DSM 14365 / JCM 11303 / SMP-2) TaxID=502025 RepID=D0LU64_HALO1|nr:NrsF family protein [Haliangium ochraceum]ACY17428.1 conserved hypothetical protein [Haliangium ochraceum DSM 14365]
MSEERIEHSLRALAGAQPALPAFPAELEAELDDLQPVQTRRPRRQFATLMAVSLAYLTLLLVVGKLRPDLAALPRLWLVSIGLAWLLGFGLITWLALVPGAGEVMPRWRYAGLGAILSAIGFVAAGLLFDRHAPGQSVVLGLTLRTAFSAGTGCMLWGTITALVPAALAALMLRGSLPVGARWAGAGVGAAAGCLGGLLLHLHCPVADAIHVGLVHGGVVVVSAVLGALAIPAAARV